MMSYLPVARRVPLFRNMVFVRTNAGVLVLMALLGFVVLYPIWRIMLSSVQIEGPGGAAIISLDAWRNSFNQPGIGAALWNTVKVVVTVQAISLPIAIGIAWLLGRTDVPFGRWLEFGFWISFLLPALVTTTGWLLLLDAKYGLINTYLVNAGLFETAPFNMYSFWGIVFAHLVSNSISVKVMLLTPAFRNMNSDIEDASRICGGGQFQTLLRIVLPVLTPILLVTVLMSLIKGLEAFELELVLGAPFDFSVYSTKIYQLLQGSPPDYRAATVLATAILIVMLPLIVYQQRIVTSKSYVTVTGQGRQSVVELGTKRWLIFACLFLVVLLTTLVPIGLQLMGSFMTLFGFFDLPQAWSLTHWQSALSDVTFLRGLRNTLVLGLAAAILGVLLYSVVAYFSIRTGQRLGAALDLLSWLPFIIPGIILGLSYLWMVLEVPVFSPLYGTMGVLVLVAVLASITLGTQILKSNLLQVGRDIEDAGRVVGGSWFKTFRSILLPFLGPVMGIVAVMTFAATARSVSTIILLHSSNTTPLSVLQLGFLYGGDLGPAAVVGTVIVIISSLVALASLILASRYRITR
ncbi:MAG: ABC-type Fe3+ transport system permease component [Noviherbaspirillum sp.]|nr:ABC-type Fe3+ transport system permease component [Noviherbaspirillum sp.]